MIARPSLLALSLLLLAPPAAAQDPEPEERVWIDLHSPPDGAELRLPAALVEVRGTTGAGTPHRHDLAVVLDLSVSTRLPSGVDVDGDGAVGRSSAEVREDFWGSATAEQLCDDLDDTIAAAELEAARKLLDFLDLRLTRVALVAFGDRGVVEAAAGSPPEDLRDTLDRLDGRHGWYGGTHYAAAVEAALGALRDATGHGVGTEDGAAIKNGLARRRTVLLLTDGYPTLPAPEPEPIREAAAAARAAADAGARLMIFALGPEALRGREILRHMARVSGGGLTEVERPGDVLKHLPLVNLSGVAGVAIQNLTSGRAARAVWLSPDGSFDGFVPLEPGPNRIRVAARGLKGGVHVEERTVVYDPAAELDAAAAAELRRLRAHLRDRTLELELVEQMQRERRTQLERNLQLEVDPTDEAPGPQSGPGASRRSER